MHGPEASWKPALTATQSIGVGYSIDATINVGTSRYSGNPKKITRAMIVTNSANGDLPTMWISGGATALGKIGGALMVTPTDGGFIYGTQLSVGAGLPFGLVPVNGAVGISNTWLLWDFAK